MYLILFLVPIIGTFVPCSALPVDPNCDYFQDMVFGKEYYLYNKDYPQKSKGVCRWIGQSPPGTVIVLSCNEVEMPFSRDCQTDKVAFSPYGEDSLDTAELYCGNTSFVAYTYGNRLAIGYYAYYGGKMLCTVAVMTKARDGCSCGMKSQMKIVGGTDTGTNEYPSMAALVDVANDNVFCGASIIANKYALTAAHCFINQQANNLRLLVGVSVVNTGHDADKGIPIAYFVQHPEYSINTQENDIGIVKTQWAIQFNLAVSPICLPFKYREYNFLSDKVTVLGFGFQDFGGNKADTLQKADLNVVSNQVCDQALSEDIQATHICTYADGKDACIADSGGPCIYQDFFTNKLELVGIISYGMGCATIKPSVNTRVTAFLSWVVSQATDAAFCII